MTGQQLLGLSEVLPKGYPKKGGVIVVTGKGKASSKVRRRRKPPKLHPWYNRSIT